MKSKKELYMRLSFLHKEIARMQEEDKNKWEIGNTMRTLLKLVSLKKKLNFYFGF